MKKDNSLSNSASRAIVTIGIGILSHIIYRALPIPEINAWQWLILFFALLLGLYIWIDYLNREKAILADEKPDKEKIKAKNKIKLSFQALPRYTRRPFKFFTFLISLISKPYYWRMCFWLFIPVAVMFIVYIVVSFSFDSKWDSPKSYSQVVHLENPWGLQKDELNVDWYHFGSFKDKREIPQTYLISVGTDDNFVDLSKFEEKYFTIEPDTLPRNNLKMLIKQVSPDISLKEGLIRFAKENQQIKKASNFWMPTVYSIQIEGKTPGSELTFKRMFNFRTRPVIEQLIYYLFILFGSIT